MMYVIIDGSRVDGWMDEFKDRMLKDGWMDGYKWFMDFWVHPNFWMNPKNVIVLIE